jgi:transposase
VQGALLSLRFPANESLWRTTAPCRSRRQSAPWSGSVRVRTSAGGARPRSHPKVVIADGGYDAGAFRRYLRRRGIRCVIPEKRIPAGKRSRRRGPPPTFCRTTYCQRNMVERLVGWLKEHRRIATRFEKLASSFLAMVKLSFVRRYFRMLERFSGST